jgi:hypothetical protein
MHVVLLKEMANHLGRQRHVWVQRDWLYAGVLQVDLVNVSDNVFVNSLVFKEKFPKIHLKQPFIP